MMPNKNDKIIWEGKSGVKPIFGEKEMKKQN